MLERPNRQRPLGIDVLTAARQRIARVFEEFPRVCVSFSGGKDSGVLLHLAADEARRRGRRFAVLFIDWEAQYQLTMEYIASQFEAYADLIDPYWVALPLTTTNAVSQFEPEWIAWDPDKRDLWVREPPPIAITDPSALPFYTHAMTFEEFVPAFGRWYAGDQLTACLVGIRTGESLNRWRTATNLTKSMYEGLTWTTWFGAGLYNAYPLYDWQTEDIWRYYGREKRAYNHLYDRMHRAGVPLHSQRICEPYGDQQRKGLWLFHIIEPQTWVRVVARVAGANQGALYSREQGSILGSGAITKPDHLSWQAYVNLLLDSMPPKTADHYRDKIARYVWYCGANYAGRYADGLPETAPGDTSSTDVPSWRHICKVLLKNDYWCAGLSFSATKTTAYDKYKKIMKKRRQSWGIYAH